MSNKPSDYWSECGQVYFLDGWGWGLTDEYQRICLGKEGDILKLFETGQLDGDLHPRQKEALNWILEYRKEEGFGEPTSGASVEREGNNGATRRKSKAARPLTPRERLPLRLSRTKNKSLSRK